MKKTTFSHLAAALLLALSLILPTACKDFLKKQVDGVDANGLLLKTGPAVDSLSKTAGRGLASGFAQNAKSVSEQLLIGLKGSMDTLDPDYQKLKSKIEELGKLTGSQVDSLGNVLEKRLGKLKNSVKDEDLKRFLLSIVEESTGKLKTNTRSLLSDMLQKAIDDLDAETAGEKLQIMLKGALGDSTRYKAQQLVHEALRPTVDTILNRVEKIVRKDLPFVQRQATNLLLALGAIACGIIGWVWYQRRRYARLVSLLTYNIHKMPSQEMYDELTRRIQDQAQKEEMETFLRQVLKEQGLKG
jgi:hypothetical protein